MDSPRAGVYRVGDTDVDLSLGCLRRGSDEIHVRPRTLQVLLHLIEQRHRLVTREELFTRFWPDTAVTDDALAQCLVEIRHAFGDSFREPRVIRTLPKAGFRFIADVEELPAIEPLAASGRPAPSRSTIITVDEERTTEIELIEEHSGLDLVDAPLALPPAPLSVRRRRAFWTGVVVVTIAVTAGAAIAAWRLTSRSSPTPEASRPAAPGKLGVVVLYFANQSNDVDAAWLREGLADMLIANLSRARQLAVLSRQELQLQLAQIGHAVDVPVDLTVALKVAHRSRASMVVLGTFARFGTTIQVRVQLHDTATGRLQAAESVTVEQPEKTPAQIDALSLKLAAHLGASMPLDAARLAPMQVMTDNLEAYRYYSLGVERAVALERPAALSLLERAVALDPEFAMAHARIGYVLGVAGSSESDQAKAPLERAFRLTKRLTDKDRLFIAAWYAIVNHDYAAAITTFRQVVASYPAEMEAYVRLGLLLQGEERHDEAIRVLEQGLAFSPGAPELLRQLGILYADRNDHERAIQWLTKAVGVSPGVAVDHERLAAVYRWTGRYQEAATSYQRALALNATFDLAVLGLGNVYADQGRYREAMAQYRRHFDELETTSKGNAYRYVQWLYLRLGDIDRAERVGVEMKQIQGVAPWNALLIAFHRGRTDEVTRLTNELSESSPRLVGGRRGSDRLPAVNRGRIALVGGRIDDALAQFRRAVESRPNFVNIETLEDSLANAYLDLGRLDEAIVEYQRVLRVNPNHALSRYHLALAFKRRGRLTEAEAERRRFLDLWRQADNDIPELVDARGPFQGVRGGATGWPGLTPRRS